ncbi:MAG: oxidoreductase, partial [Streptosporangiales bacterium]|nr:oxidoreductase [Streptosporangiales bacterium]
RSTPPSDPVLQGALRATGEVGALVATWRRAPGQALARLHAVVAADAAEPGALGRPASELAARRLHALGALLAAPTDASALVVAAVVHGEVASLPAFTWGSGVVARTAGRLVLVSRGMDRQSLLAPEIGHLELRDEYASALRAYADGDVGTWVRHCASAVTAAARDALAVCEALRRG